MTCVSLCNCTILQLCTHQCCTDLALKTSFEFLSYSPARHDIVEQEVGFEIVCSYEGQGHSVVARGNDDNWLVERISFVHDMIGRGVRIKKTSLI